MRILVTGSSGFVGQHLVMRLATNQIHVTGLDYKPWPLVWSSPSFVHKTYMLGSFKEDLAELLNTVDAIVHLASESNTDKSILDPGIFVQHNVLGTVELFEAARRSTNVRQIVLLSSDKVGVGSFPERGHAFKCGSPYSASKGAQELFAQAYANTYNIPIITVRSVNIFGPMQSEEHFVPMVISKSLRDEFVPIYGDGMQMRQWVHVNHVASFINEVATSNMIPPDSVLHISGTKEIYNLVLAHTILSLTGKPASLIKLTKDRSGHTLRHALIRTEDTNDFLMGHEYQSENFLKDLEATVSWFKARHDALCRNDQKRD